MRLFVDCDDTLVLYNQKGINPCGAICGTPFIINRELVAYVRRFAVENPDALIVIWSGGGNEYARAIAERARLTDVGAAYLTKCPDTFALVCNDDIVFDDLPIVVPARVRGPHEFEGL